MPAKKVIETAARIHGYDLPDNFAQFLSAMHEIESLIPVESRRAARIEIENDESVLLAVSYIRDETPQEQAERELREANNAGKRERDERERLDQLIAKYGIPPTCDHLVPYAKLFAIMAHGNQTYGTGVPYAHHLETVARIVEPYGNIAQIAAYLHDIVEDTTITLDEVRGLFGEEVARAVDLCTDGPGDNRKIRKANANTKLAKADALVDRIGLIVKAADRLANVRESYAHDPKKLKMYRDEHPEFQIAVFRQGLCPEIWLNLQVLLATAPEES